MLNRQYWGTTAPSPEQPRPPGKREGVQGQKQQEHPGPLAGPSPVGAMGSLQGRVWKAAKQGLAGMPQQRPGWILLSGNISLQRQKDEASKWRGSGILDSSKTGSGAVLRKDGKTCEIPATQSPGSHGAPGFEIYFMGYKWVSPAPKTACKVAESIAESRHSDDWANGGFQRQQTETGNLHFPRF